MKRRDVINIAILLVVILIAVYRYKVQTYTETRSRFLMDTLVELSFSARQQNVPAIMDSTITVISRYEKKFSYYDPESYLWAINHSEEDSLIIDRELFELLNLAEIFYQETEGVYDITIGILSEIWDIDRTTPPPADSVRLAQEYVGFDKIRYGYYRVDPQPDESSSEISDEAYGYLIRPPGLKLNLSSLAKGYIIDKGVAYARSRGIESGYINAGGDILLFGDRGGKQRIGIQHPRDINDIIAVLELSDIAVVTSGDYERYFEYEGRRYHHIINPLTGYPVENIFSVTVIAPDATLADILSTALFLLPPEEGISLIKKYKGAECVIYYQDEDEIVSLRTEGIREYMVEG
jgi:thiamine biosynthesis lipoprotein